MRSCFSFFLHSESSFSKAFAFREFHTVGVKQVEQAIDDTLCPNPNLKISLDIFQKLDIYYTIIHSAKKVDCTRAL